MLFLSKKEQRPGVRTVQMLQKHYIPFTKAGEYPFYFVALVLDQNSIAQDRFWGHYRGTAIPTIFFDGGFNQTVGWRNNPRSN